MLLKNNLVLIMNSYGYQDLRLIKKLTGVTCSFEMTYLSSSTVSGIIKVMCQGWCVLLGCFAHAPLKWTYLFWRGFPNMPRCKQLLALRHLCHRKRQVWLPDRDGLYVAAVVDALTGVEYYKCFLTCVKAWTGVLQRATGFNSLRKYAVFVFCYSLFLKGAHEKGYA